LRAGFEIGLPMVRGNAPREKLRLVVPPVSATVIPAAKSHRATGSVHPMLGGLVHNVVSSTGFEPVLPVRKR
jgi:hypothetical protein